MSSITLYADILFDDADTAEHFERLIRGELAADSAEAQAIGNDLANLIANEDCHLDELERTDNFLRFDMDGGTISFPYAELIKALEEINADTLVIEVIDDQVGEEIRRARHRGKRIALGKARKILDQANPVLGVYNAIEDDSERRVLRIIKNGVDPNARIRGRSLLSLVCQAGFAKAAVALIDAGADCTAADTKASDYDDVTGRTPLHWACLNELPVKAIKKMIETGADVTATEGEGATPFHYAAHSGHRAAIGPLIDAGSDVDGRGGEDDLTPLLITILHGHVDAAKTLLKHGADIHAQCKHGGNALWYAHGNEACREFLLEHDLKFLRPSNAYARSPHKNMDLAYRVGDWEALPGLVDNADTDSRGAFLREHVRRSYYPDQVERLIGLGFDDVVDEFVGSVGHMMCKRGDQLTVEAGMRLFDTLRARWPKRLAEIDEQREQAMAHVRDMLALAETEAFDEIVEPLTPSTQAMVDRLLDYFAPDASYRDFAARQMYKNIGRSLKVGLSQFRETGGWSNYPMWRNEGVVGVGRMLTEPSFHFGCSRELRRIDGAWKIF